MGAEPFQDGCCLALGYAYIGIFFTFYIEEGGTSLLSCFLHVILSASEVKLDLSKTSQLSAQS